MAAFRGIHVLPAKHSYAWLSRKCDYRTDRRTDAWQSYPYVPLYFADDTKSLLISVWSVRNIATSDNQVFPIIFGAHHYTHMQLMQISWSFGFK